MLYPRMILDHGGGDLCTHKDHAFRSVISYERMNEIDIYEAYIIFFFHDKICDINISTIPASNIKMKDMI